jgi:hypothetical protein
MDHPHTLTLGAASCNAREMSAKNRRHGWDYTETEDYLLPRSNRLNSSSRLSGTKRRSGTYQRNLVAGILTVSGILIIALCAVQKEQSARLLAVKYAPALARLAEVFPAGTQPHTAVPDPRPSPAKASPAPAKKVIDLNSAEALDAEYSMQAGVSCESGADDYVRSTAKYGFKWDKSNGFEHEFDNYLRKVKTSGILTLESDRLQLQNGFGGYQRMRIYCDYDALTGNVVSFEIEP